VAHVMSSPYKPLQRHQHLPALSGLSNQSSAATWGWRCIFVRLDEVVLMKSSSSQETIMSKTKQLLLDLDSLPASDHHGIKAEAVHRRLVKHELTHFTREPLAQVPPLISGERLQNDRYGTVDNVRIGKKLYARKSLWMPRKNYQRTRADIQHEVAVIRTLDHPHIIRVFLTYEDKTQFFIIMEPLADCDLGDFLMQHTPTPPTKAQKSMVWRWFRCLANTLLFIHSKGIRHKDIKPGNLLIKYEEIVFADFGSSHVFLAGGDSTTERPSYGHTRMYCAPEVIEQARRNRAADIFSLGCVFTELAVWLERDTSYRISKWHEFRATKVRGLSTTVYHASLEKVDEWFRDNYGRSKGHEQSRGLYSTVLRRMICKEPADRLTVGEVSSASNSPYYAVVRYASTAEWAVRT
jgi:serine/threonine protein kinase